MANERPWRFDWAKKNKLDERVINYIENNMSCDWRSGPGVIQYNTTKLTEATKQSIGKNLEIECTRILLRHTYRIVPSKRFEEQWYHASNMTITQKDVKLLEFEEN